MKFLRRIDQEFPGCTLLHLVIDNYSNHSTPEVKAWLKKHRRIVIHYMPTSCSWPNLIERWFAELTNKLPPRFLLGVEDLETAIQDFLASSSIRESDRVAANIHTGGRQLSRLHDQSTDATQIVSNADIVIRDGRVDIRDCAAIGHINKKAARGARGAVLSHSVVAYEDSGIHHRASKEGNFE